MRILDILRRKSKDDVERLIEAANAIEPILSRGNTVIFRHEDGQGEIRVYERQPDLGKLHRAFTDDGESVD